MPTEASERAASLLERWRDDTLQAWDDWLPPPERPREWQRDALDDLRDPSNRRIACVGCREASKSRWLAMAGTHHLCFNPGCLVLHVAPTDRQRRASFWEETRILWERSPILRQLFPGWSVYADRIDTGVPGWRMESVSSDTAANLEGFHSPSTLLLIDEAATISDQIWNSLQGINPARVVAVGTAGDDFGWFAEAFGHMGWFWDVKRRITAEELPRLKEIFERERKRLGADNPVFRRMWLAQFCSASEYSIFDESLLRRARGYEPDPVGFDEAFLG